MGMRKILLAGSLVLLAQIAVSGRVEGKSFFENLFSTLSKAAPDHSPVASALSEALKIGIDKAVRSAGQQNGFFGNPSIKIGFPEKLAALEKILRKTGAGPRIDQFVLGMNRAAEKSAPLARDILLKSLLEMNFQDAERLLNGGDTAATDYFRNKTYDKLMAVLSRKSPG